MLTNAPRSQRRIIAEASKPASAPAVRTAPSVQPRNAGRRKLLVGLLGGATAAAFSGSLLMPAKGEVATPDAVLVPQLAPPPMSADASAADRTEWAKFKARFISAEGRVIDTGNGNVSHSEGQGYALLMAEWTNDRATFERVLAWTKANLSRPNDALFAWRWRPGQAVAVEDMNSATDGDLGIAWALARGAARWGVAAWQRQAEAIGCAVLALSTRDVAGRLLLLPGPRGFDRPGKVIVNPSYYLFPAIRALAQIVPDARWARLEQDGLWLQGAARFGRWGLSADWVDVAANNGAVTPAIGWPARFSWDAVRVPLYLVWAGEHQATAVLAAAAFWSQPRGQGVAAWADLTSGQLAPYTGHVGIQAVAALSQAAAAGRGAAPHAPVSEAPDYYAASLALLTRMAWQEAGISSAPATAMRVASR